MKKQLTKEQKELVLQKFLDKKLEQLRKRCFPWKRRVFLQKEIKIHIATEDYAKNETSWAGLYEWDENNSIHNIYINEKIANKYFYYKPNRRLRMLNKAYYKEMLMETVHHEIIHAFTNERYECFSDIKNVDSDASPIFLSILYWTFGNTNHVCRKVFERTKVCEIIDNSFLTFEELDDYLMELLLNYNKVSRKLENISDKDYKKVINNKFSFESRKAGLVPFLTCKEYIVAKVPNNKLIKAVTHSNWWNVGCNVTPKNLEKFVLERQENSHNFIHRQIDKNYVLIKSKDVKIVPLYKNF